MSKNPPDHTTLLSACKAGVYSIFSCSSEVVLASHATWPEQVEGSADKQGKPAVTGELRFLHISLDLFTQFLHLLTGKIAGQRIWLFQARDAQQRMWNIVSFLLQKTRKVWKLRRSLFTPVTEYSLLRLGSGLLPSTDRRSPKQNIICQTSEVLRKGSFRSLWFKLSMFARGFAALRGTPI